jgi:glycosyltransferase involved in cell wall biosynthesis
LIKYLSNYVQLTVVNTGPAPENIEQYLGENYRVSFFILEKTKYLTSNGYGRRLKMFLKGKQFDTVIIEYIHSSYFVNFLTGPAKVILDAHDIISDRTEDFRKFGYPGALYELTRQTEFEIFSAYDHVIMLCEPDYEKVSAIIGRSKTLMCPHPVTANKIRLRKQVKNIVFVGSAYLPNMDAITFFIDHCWDQIIAKHPVKLSIYGTVCDGLRHIKNERIFLGGRVDDIASVYNEADIIINPVRFGAGLKIKNLEALAYGIPLVTTTHGARGLDAINEMGLLVANYPDDFIAAIFRLIEHPKLRKELGGCAHAYIKRKFTPQKCFKSLLKNIL